MTAHPLTDRDRLLAAEARVAELEDVVAAYRANEREGEDAEARLRRYAALRDLLRRGNVKAGHPRCVLMISELLEHVGTTVSYERLLRRSRGPGCSADEPNLKQCAVQINYTRRAFEAFGWPPLIDCTWGFGYSLTTYGAELIRAALGGAHE